MFHRKVEILSETKLPTTSKVLDSIKPSHLTVMDDLLPTLFIMVTFVYENIIPFDHILKGIKSLLKDGLYETFLTVEYRYGKDGRWFRTNESIKETVWIIEAQDNRFKLSETLKIDDLPKGLVDVYPHLGPDLHTGKLHPTPTLIIQHTTLGSGHCAITIALHHCIGDASTLFMLIGDLVLCCNGQKPRPIHLNNIEHFPCNHVPEDWQIEAPHKLLQCPEPKCPQWLRNGFEYIFPRPEYLLNYHRFPTLLRQKQIIFHICRDTVRTLRAKSDTFLSNNDILSGMSAWALTRTRFAHTYKIPEEIFVTCLFSLRKNGRVDPPLPERFLGNTILYPVAKMATEDILNKDPELAILMCAKAIRASLKELEKPENVDKHLKYFQSSNTRKFYPSFMFMNNYNLITVTNWSSFHTVDPKFITRGNNRVVYSGPMPHDIRSHGAEGFFRILNGLDGHFHIHTCILDTRVQSYVNYMSQFGRRIFH